MSFHTIIYVMSMLVVTSCVSAQTPSYNDLIKANDLLKTEPQQSWRMFENAQPYFDELNDSHKMDWFKLGVEAATNMRDLQRGWNVTKMYFDHSWNIADRKRKLFIIQHFARLASISNNYDQAYTLFDCAEHFQNDALHKLRIANNKGAVLIQTARWEEARAVYLTGIALAEKNNHQQILAAMNNNIGEVWMSLNELEKAIDAYKKAYIIKARIDNETSQLSSLSNLMRVIYAVADWQQWDKYYALYIRLLRQVKIEEFQAIHDWMLASKALSTENKTPDANTVSALATISLKVQSPDSKRFINEIAQKLVLPPPFDISDKFTSLASRNPELDGVIVSCQKEISLD